MRSLTRYESFALALAGALVCLLLQGGTAHATGTPKGTTISNSATTNYSDINSNSYTATSNSVSVSVTAIYRVELTCGEDQSGNSGSTVYYPCTITNTSNDTDTFALSATSDWGPAVFYADNGAGGGTPNDGIHTSGETTSTTTTGALAADATYKFFLAVPIPPGTANALNKPATVTATGSADAAPDDKSVTVTTTAKAPALTVVKKVRNFSTSGAFADSASARPEQELEYQVQVTNNGALQAKSVMLYDTLDAELDFVSGSLRAGSAATYDGAGNSAKSDTTSGDAACGADSCATGNFNSTSRKVTFYLGTTATEGGGGNLNTSSTVYVYYHVKVK